MITYRTSQPGDRAACLLTANAAFSKPGAPVDFAAMLPKVYGEDRPMTAPHEIAVDDAGKVLGLVGVLPGTLCAGGRTLKTGYLGTMGVHPDARGLGVMKELMTRMVADIRDMGCDLTLLDGLRQRYEYQGYTPAGIAWHATVCRDNVHHALKGLDASGVTFAPILPGTPLEEEAAALHRRRSARFDRDALGFATVCRSYGGQGWAALRGGELLGFLVADRRDAQLTDLCAPDVLTADLLLKAWLEQREVDEVRLRLPDWEQPLLRHLATWAEELSLQQAVNARILHYAPVIEALLRLKASYTRLQDGTWAFEAEGQRVTIRVQQGQVTVTPDAAHPVPLTGLEANRLLLYPFPWEGMPETVPGWFPLPLYACAPDGF